MRRRLADLAAAAGGTLHGADATFAEVVIDSRHIAAGDLFVALPGTRADGHDFVAAAAAAGAAGALVARRVDAALAQIVVADVAAALSRAARAWRAAFSGSVLAVAGSNGKTTTKEMLAAILAQGGVTLATRGNLNNELGVPLTLLRLAPCQRAAVIEIGANHPGEVAALAALADPHIGLVTNAGAEHLAGFGSIEGVARAEGELFAALPSTGTAIINVDDVYAPLWRGMTRAGVVGFGFAAGADVRAAGLRFDVGARGCVAHFELSAPAGRCAVELALAGRHNVQNALGAAAAALAAGASLSHVAAGLAAMRAVGGRLQFRPAHSGAWLIDDSYNANPSSVRAAIDVLADLGGRRWLVLGDMGELGDYAAGSHRDAGRYARARGVERLYAHGPLAALAAREFGSGAQCFDAVEPLLRALRADLAPGVRLLIKGSRLNHLERVVAALADNSDAAAPPAAQQAG
ncbi:MAG: UDP-N-acetylmuramoyl-tripeptide--D-alanyl-D-alanine ligase [Gammaproteobacteria bacterium]|nr:UDP-N-acetylmuramoyl-tripeptide--D-alanyl-D-alanine ligase [Gammaproteobacteria bacterium]